ncbi:MAG TPA: FtsX-like permease family protein [Candidatus Limnocylindrales bacterium]|nr:FtsX-like permease family protein [Candidatus Limnocylindrales bacterium]
MRGLVPYAWRGLVARPARSLLTVLGIAIGVAVLVAALAVSAGLDASVEKTVASIVGRADLRVAAFTEQGLSATTLAALDRVPGVALTAPAIERRSFLASAPGLPTVTEPVTVLGIDPDCEPRVRDLVLASGVPLGGQGEAASLITERLAAATGLALGSPLSILGAGAPLRTTVVGILEGEGPALGSSGRTVLVSLEAAHRLLVADADDSGPSAALGGVTRIDVVLAAGADAAAVTEAIAGALTTEPYVLTAPQDIAASMRASTADIRATMALLASITLFAAAFLVLNATAMTVVERIRELGLLRAAGASRGQLVRIVELQALMLGIAGSLLGLALGGGLAFLVAAWLRASRRVTLDAPAITVPILLAGLGVGILVTLVAALEPARRAGSVSPVTALRARSDPSTAARSHIGWLVVVVLAVGVLAVLLLPVGAASPTGPVRAVAVYALLLLGVLVTPALLGPLGRAAGLPFSIVFRLEERLARAALARDRARTTLTIGALVVGLAMVVALGAVAANARVAATAWLGDVVPGDAVLTAIAPAPTGEGGVDEQLADLAGVRLATPVASFDLAFGGARLEATAIDGHDFEVDGRLTFTAGDRSDALAALDAGGAVVLPRARAQRMGVGLGDPIVVIGTDGLVELRVAGIVERSFPGKTGETALVGWGDAETSFGITGADAIAVRYEPGMEASASPAVTELATRYALTVSPIAEVEGAVGDALDSVFGLLDLLAAAAVVIAALGIVNTLSMDTWERVRELGMLRAVGMSRRQVWRSVLVEAGILGVIGSVVGISAGVLVGIVLVATAGGTADAGIRLPWPAMGVSLLIGVSLSMLAAAQPARIAGRRSIVSAVRGE